MLARGWGEGAVAQCYSEKEYSVFNPVGERLLAAGAEGGQEAKRGAAHLGAVGTPAGLGLALGNGVDVWNGERPGTGLLKIDDVFHW